ncbi:hypothetical protein [Nonomuraea rubra]|uniref:Uncharacterized protein n=1 Tax=Nonomuraea rubra TaxID=46180 RepID=A0A7X0NTP3_9ACTN|nr:hypothetical protein [Nonomuraea rubra]MBB6549447.1 hypothetical protein [Nonomuraea rubra]
MHNPPRPARRAHRDHRRGHRGRGQRRAAGSSAARARLFELYVPREFKLLHDTDDARYLLGLPNKFDLFSPYWPGR